MIRKKRNHLGCEASKKGEKNKRQCQHSTHRDLLAQEIHVFLAVAQALLRGAEFVGQKLFGFGDWVGEHDVGLMGEREGWRLVMVSSFF